MGGADRSGRLDETAGSGPGPAMIAAEVTTAWDALPATCGTASRRDGAAGRGGTGDGLIGAGARSASPGTLWMLLHKATGTEPCTREWGNMPRWKGLPTELDPEHAELVVMPRHLKDHSGLSLRQLAAKTGYSSSSWERYLGGRALPPRGDGEGR
ncbi:hypothetical protein SHIRM173S_07885 [Streptomyces hirsutus]